MDTQMTTETFIYKDYLGSIEVSVEDACLHGRILFIDDLIIYEGQTLGELKAAFQSAVDSYLAACEQLKREPQKRLSGTFNVRIGPDLHRKSAVAARTAGIKLNEFVRSAIIQKLKDKPEITVHYVHEHVVRSEKTMEVSFVSSAQEFVQGESQWSTTSSPAQH